MHFLKRHRDNRTQPDPDRLRIIFSIDGVSVVRHQSFTVTPHRKIQIMTFAPMEDANLCVHCRRTHQKAAGWDQRRVHALLPAPAARRPNSSDRNDRNFPVLFEFQQGGITMMKMPTIALVMFFALGTTFALAQGAGGAVEQEAQEVAARAQVALELKPVEPEPVELEPAVLELEPLGLAVPGLAEPVLAAVVRPAPGAAAAILLWM
jgi:hypothetical protein